MKSRNKALGTIGASVIMLGLVLGTIRDWFPLTFIWDHKALAEDVAEKRMQLTQTMTLTHQQIAASVKNNNLKIIQIDLDLKFRKRLAYSEARRECEETPGQDCAQLRLDEQLLLHDENMLRDELKRLKDSLKD